VSSVTTQENDSHPWYHGVTPYQWLVLVIACLGWIFDVFEGQIFVASMNQAMPALVPPGTTAGDMAFYNNIALSSFLLGGALGGVLFGVLADRIGRTKTLIITILMYSLFTCVTAFSRSWQEMALLRFLVAMGVGGEWAVASAMVAEVFSKKARAWSGAIFHGSSVFGTYLAVAAGVFIVNNPNLGWRWGFAVGALPALLTLWIRWKLREPESWVAARSRAQQDRTQRAGRISELFVPPYLKRTLIGVSLATIGLATFWGVHIYGKDFLQHRAKQYCLEVEGVSPDAADEIQQSVFKKHGARIKRAEMLGMFLTTTGGGLGLLMFGPICERIGRRQAFVWYHLGALVIALAMFKGLATSSDILLYFVLPVFGFLTLGMHAGYAVYFPELYPTRLRGTGAGFCFNFARLLAAVTLVVNGVLQQAGVSFENAASSLSLLFLLGVVLMIFAPETKGTELPE
jgi:MFS family permease